MIRLETKNLIIRDHIETDLESLHVLLSDNDVMKYLDFNSKIIEDSQNNLKICIDESKKDNDRVKYYFAIIEKVTNKYIGEIGFTIIKKNKYGGICNLGYFIHKEFWGKGYTTEATKKVIGFIFENTELHKIETGCVRDNIASEKIMIKCGFGKEADLLKHSFFENEWKDRVEYGLLKSDWIKNNK